jgi:hypothetical protein
MKTITLAVILFALAGPAIAQDETRNAAVFDSAAQAYAFAAAHDDTSAVLRTEDNPPRWLIVRDTPGVVILAQINFPTSVKVAGSVQASGNIYATGGSNNNIYADGHIDAALYFSVNGTQVVGAQQPAIAAADGSAADLTAKVNALLAAMRAHGLIAK